MDRNRIKLAALMLIIFLPLSLATWLFFNVDGMSIGGTTNRGQLIQPVMDITEFGLLDRNGDPVFRPFEESVAGIDPEQYDPRPWTLLYLGASDCDEACRERLYFLRQLHRRLGAEARRVERYYAIVGNGDMELGASTAAHFAEQLPEMKLAASEASTLRQRLARTHEPEQDPIGAHYIYVVDPVGNVMLYFTPDNTPEDILNDLETLLDQTSLG